MFPVFRPADRAAFDPALLANDFQKWITAFKENTRKNREEVKTAPKPGAKSPVSERDAYLSLILRGTPTWHRSPALSFYSPPLHSPSISKYFSNKYFKIRPSPKGGLGAFAIEDIPNNTAIIAENPLFRCHLYEEIEWSVDRLPRRLKDEYFSLYHWAGVDQNKVHGIFKTNRFETSSMSGIFLTCSRFNHACHPHTTCTYTWDEQQKKLIVSTLRDIDAGEELTISYMGWSVDRGILKHNYGFDCDCPGCLQEIEAEAEAGKESAKVTAIPPRRHRHICF